MKNKISSFRNYYVLLIVLISLISFSLLSCNPGISENKQDYLSSDSVKEAAILSKRIFFLLDAMGNTSTVKNAISEDEGLKLIYRKERKAIVEAVKGCPDMDCLVKALEISKEENESITTLLGALYKGSDAIQNLMNEEIRPSHAFALSESLPDSALFIEAWQEQKSGLNHIFHAYLQNKGLHYVSIDSASFNVNSKAYLDTIKWTIRQLLNHEKKSDLFFQPVLNICIKILQLNHRNEAARFIPLSTVNKNAYDEISHINWKEYPYSAILVFGEGPTDPDVAISPNNKERCREGVKFYKRKQAPFLIVSGGYVHPYRTQYCEAEQMKKFMMDSLGIPEKAIIMEPHARHTTTNIRNANRIIFEEKIPFDKPVLGVTSKSHIDYIVAERFKKTCRRDLSFIPFTGLKRLSDFSVAFYPTIESLQIDAMAPLDP